MITAPDTRVGPDIRTGNDPRFPSGPTFLSRVFSGRLFQQPSDFMLEMARDHGDLVHYRAAGHHVFQFNHPELVQDVLVTDARHHLRGIVMQRSKMVLGEGLLTSEEPLHMRQRRLAQPAFHRDRITAYGRIIGQFAAEATAQWQTGTVRQVHTDMQTLALRIVGKTLFDQEMEGDTASIAAAIDAFMGILPLVFLPFSSTLQKLPIPLVLRIKRSRAELDKIIYGIIAERRAQAHGSGSISDRGDLLSMLLASVDTEENTGGMSDAQVRDECVTTMLAGNETTANALSFALWLLAMHPEQQQRLHEEAAEVLGGRMATAEDYPRLRYTWMCFAEAMRLYPPVWVTARTAAKDYQYRGFTIPKDSLLLSPQIVLHRDPRFWDEPQKFDPGRFGPEEATGKSSRSKMSYFPFAAGSRQCIGEGLAWMEGVLSLATIAHRWRLSPPPHTSAEIQALARISMRPKGEVPLLVEQR